MKKRLLVILGVGASIAQLKELKHTVYQTKGFFDNPIQDDTPHLKEVINAIEKINIALPNDARFWNKSLTQVWLIMDSMKKYHLAKTHKRNYDELMLNKRLKRLLASKDDNGNYKIINYVRDIWDQYANSKPSINYNSVAIKYLPKTIFSLDDLDKTTTIAYFELMYLIIERYSIDNSKKGFDIKNSPFSKLFATLIKSSNDLNNNLYVINLNYDVIFENSLFEWEKNNPGENKIYPLSFVRDMSEFINIQKFKGKKVQMCKPHGGFNLNHDSDKATIDLSINPYVGFNTERFKQFDHNFYEPYLIPYFLHPDEFTIDHNNVFTHIGKYFVDQRKILCEMFKSSTHILSIGYSFPETDDHLFDKLDSRNSPLKVFDIDIDPDKNEDSIETLFNKNNTIVNKGNINLYQKGFDSDSINEFESWMKNN